MERENMKRNSSIEMVRIIAMMFIIMGHLAGHGILKVTTTDSFEMWRGGQRSINYLPSF